MRWVPLAATLVAAPVLAVESGNAPVAARWSVRSADGTHLVEMDPLRMETAVFRLDAQGRRVRLWSMPGWFSRVALSNDGAHLVVASEKGGLVPANWRPDDVLLRFYERGHLVREVTLAEVVPDLREMIRVRSCYYWGRTKGFDAEGRYVVETVDRTVRFAADGTRS